MSTSKSAGGAGKATGTGKATGEDDTETGASGSGGDSGSGGSKSDAGEAGKGDTTKETLKTTLDASAPSEDRVLLERRILQLEGEKAAQNTKLLAARQETERARAEVTALQAKLTERSVSLLPDLGDASRELLESVTLTQVGTTAPGYAKQGDVVTLGDEDDAKELQRTLGDKARVFRVSEAMAEELSKLGLIRR